METLQKVLALRMIADKNKTEDYVLTIAVPTYNRGKYLDLCLAQICKQLPGNEQLIELIVSDNNSTDNTEEIVKKYTSQGHNIKYTKNKENIGAERNVIQCYTMAKGKYVLVFGDDDVLADNAITKVVKILQEGDYGVAYLNAIYEKSTIEKLAGRHKYAYTVYNDITDFVKAVHYRLTFISGNAVNKYLAGRLLQADELDEILGLELPQLMWILAAAFSAEQNIVIENIILYSGLDGVARGRLCQTFGINANKIFNIFINKGVNKSFFEIINQNMLRTFFPFYILANRINPDKHRFTKEDHYRLLYPIYHKYFLFWFSTAPVIKLPLFFINLWILVIRGINKFIKETSNIMINPHIKIFYDIPVSKNKAER